jgi:GT2 family glycosyltransferase
VVEDPSQTSRESVCGVSIVIPLWNGREWLPGCLAAVGRQTLPADRIIVVDNGSTDDSAAYLSHHHPDVEVLPLGHNTGFAHAANRGIARCDGDFVVLLNTDVVLEPDWLARVVGRAQADPRAGSVACKMVQLDDPGTVYDAGDVLRRDGACEQRGRFGRDDGRWDVPGEVFGACAGAALYRRSAFMGVDGFDERYFAYIEDVDLAVRLRLAGWCCLYEPAVAHHAGEGSSHQLSGAHHYYVERNTLLLVGTFFPLRWLHLVAYRQASWLRAAARGRYLGPHLRGGASGLVLAFRAWPRRRRARRDALATIGQIVPAMPVRGPRALGHRHPTNTDGSSRTGRA